MSNGRALERRTDSDRSAEDGSDSDRTRPAGIGHSAIIPTAPPAATPTGSPDGGLPSARYLNRELSWLDFNSRVLALAEDTSLPLLERAKFLAIFASNLDEFYMVRVAGLKRRDETGLSVRSADGLSPREQLALIGSRTQEISYKHARVFLDSVRPALADEGISIIGWSDLDSEERTRLSAHFHEQVFPVLTPLAVDPAHPFPYISGLSLNLAVTVKDAATGGEHFARVKVPDNVDRFVRVTRTGDTPGSIAAFLPTEDLIAATSTYSSPAWKWWSTTLSASHAMPISRSRRIATRTCSRHSSANWPDGGSVPRSASRWPTT